MEFLERSFLSTGTVAWGTLQYMVSRVSNIPHGRPNDLVWQLANVYYGGKIVDRMDFRLFTSYVELWMKPEILHGSFSFNPDKVLAKIPDDFNYDALDA